MKKKTDEQRHKKRNIFSVVCFSFFFQCSSHSLAGPVLCVCTLVWKYQYQSKRLLCALALYSLSLSVSLPSIRVCLCVCVQWKRLRVLNETQNIRLYVYACVCIYICISICVHVRWARDRRISVCVFGIVVCVLVSVSVCAAMYSLKISQPTEATVQRRLVRTRKSFESFSCCCGCLVWYCALALLALCVYSPLVSAHSYV